MIDIGANLANRAFAADLDGILARAVASGVSGLVATGTSVEVTEACAGIAADRWGVFFTSGVHPHGASGWDMAAEAGTRAMAGHSLCVAVGETGLDYYRDLSPRDVQRRVFERQLQIAVEVGKPAFLHQRGAVDDFYAILSDYAPSLRGFVVHCFSEGPAEAERTVGLGGFVGFTGWLLDKGRGGAAREAALVVPADRVLFETDAPYLSPPGRPRRCEPSFLGDVVDGWADLTGTDRAVARDLAAANPAGLFLFPERRAVPGAMP